MKWQIKYMGDPGDGIVSETIVEHASDDICEVAADAFNGECIGADGEKVVFHGWIIGIEALPPGE